MDYKQKVDEKRQKLVDTLIAFIESNPTQWEAGWYSVPNETPWNGKTQKKYNGLNAFYLCVLSAMSGYKDPRWVTFNQSKELGANVKSGEKSSEVFYWSKYDKKTKQPFDNKTCDGMTFEEAHKYMEENVRPVLKFYQVFNAEQCENMPEYSRSTTLEMEAEERRRQNLVIEHIISNSAAPISYDGGNRAYYSPRKDSIHLPEIKDFKTMQDYYATALHEVAHSTGHDSRLNRNLRGLFGSPDYAKEELCAELASVFMQVEYGISIEGKHFENHGAYLASWLKSVKDNQKEFFSAAADAEKITSYVADNYLHKQEIKEHNYEKEIEPKFEANTSFAKQVDDVLSGADTTSTHLKVMGTPLILRQLGAQNLPVLMTAKHLRNIVAKNGGDTSVNYHGLDADLVKKLPELLADPVIVMDSLTKPDSVVIVTSTLDKENRPIIGAIKFDGHGNLNDVEIDANILTSAYGKDNFKNFIKFNIDKDTILYWDKEKSQELIKTPGFQLPDNLNSLATNTIIRKSQAFVNRLDEKIENKVENIANNVDNRRLSELETKISQDRIDELQHNFMNESNDEETQEWRDSLLRDEEQIIAEWDKSYLKGTTELLRDITLEDKRQEKLAENLRAISPLYADYMRTQEENPNATVLQRIGDFYEVMGVNATVVAESIEQVIYGLKTDNKGDEMDTEDKIRDLIESSVVAVVEAVQKGLGKQTFTDIVKMTTSVVHKLGTKLIEEVVSDMDEQYNKARDRHAIIMRNNKSRRMITQMGEITLTRRLYYDKIRRNYFFAVDELLDIERRSRIDVGLKQELISNATLTSFGKASEISGHKVSRQTVHNIVKKLPPERVKVKAQGHKAIDAIYIEADEDHIHLNNGVSAEVKLVYVHEGTKRIGRNRTELINPKYFTSVKKSDEEIWAEVFDYVCSQYKTSSATIHISGDGAQWIKSGLDYFPRAKYHLDKFHVYKSITEVSGTDKAMRRAVLEAIKNKDFETIQEWYTIRNQRAVKPREKKHVSSGLFYLENNFDEIDLTKTYSCAAEGHVSHVLSARLSSRPMGWSIDGAGRMAKLRAYYFNGGNFSDLISRQSVVSSSINFANIAANKNRYSRITSKGEQSSSTPSAHVVGLDGITNGLSVLLRSTLRSKKS